MKKYRKMLVPLDGSKLAEEVFPYAQELSCRLDLELVFLNVCRPDEVDLLPVRQSYIDQMVEMNWNQICKLRNDSGTRENVKTLGTVGKVVVGYPAEEILKYSEENGIDIILLATHGYSGIRRWALGSVAYKVLHASNIPIWLIRSGTPRERVMNRWPQDSLLVPLDRSGLAESALPHVEALAMQRGKDDIEVILINVCEPAEISAEFSYYTFTEYPASKPLKYEDYEKQEIDRARKKCSSYLEQAAKKLKSSGLKVKTEVLFGDAAEELIKYINNNPLQLVVMASHGRSGFRRLVFGSVAEKILLQGHSPVFIVPRQD